MRATYSGLAAYQSAAFLTSGVSRSGMPKPARMRSQRLPLAGGSGTVIALGSSALTAGSSTLGATTARASIFASSISGVGRHVAAGSEPRSTADSAASGAADGAAGAAVTLGAGPGIVAQDASANAIAAMAAALAMAGLGSSIARNVPRW